MPSEHDFSLHALKQQCATVPESWERLRFQRALSWLERSEKESLRRDRDVQFILLWIALDALFSCEQDIMPPIEKQPHSATLFGKIAQLLEKEDVNSGNVIWQAIYQQSNNIAQILKNPYIFAPFWRAVAENGVHSPDTTQCNQHPAIAQSRRLFSKQNAEVFDLLKQNDTDSRGQFIVIVLRRLAILRNQLMHGAAEHSEPLNRSQVEHGYQLLSVLMPRIVYVMLRSPDKQRGVVAYPPYGEKDALFDRAFTVAEFQRLLRRTFGKRRHA